MQSHVIIADDDTYLLDELVPRLQAAFPQARFTPCFRASDALDAALASTEPTIVVTDYDLRAARDGADLLADVEAHRPAHGRVLMSGHTREALSYAFMRCRPSGFVQKTPVLDGMVPALVGAIQAAAPGALATAEHAAVAGAEAGADADIYRLLVESVRDYAIFVLDPRGRVVTWNPGAERIYGYTAQEAIGRHFRVFHAGEDQGRGHPEAELRAALADGRYEEEGVRLRKDGARIWASIALTPLLSPGGELRGFAKITRDLTHRRAAEEQMRRHAKELEDLSQELEAFSATLAHDVRGPLRAVAAAFRNVRLHAADPEQVLRAAAAGEANTAAMSRLVDDLLQLAHATKAEVAPQRLDVSALAREVGLQVLEQAGRPAAQLEVQDGLHALGDPKSMRVVLHNLLSNAVKYTARAAAPRIRFGRKATPDGPLFFLEDNGVGFSPELAARLFRPFQRLHAPVDFEGTGLGLATVRRIIERHGGRVWIEGAPDRGATVWFSLRPSSPQATTATTAMA